MRLGGSARGFSLVELAVVLVIVGFLMVSGILAFNAQVEQRNYDETTRRLNLAAETVLAFAIANRRLPCPAAPLSTGVEAPAGGTCSNSFSGFLPAESLGFAYYDSDRYALDAYGNRIRYAVAAAITGCTGSSTTPHFTSVNNLRANGISCRPNDLDVCTNAACAARVISAQTAVFVVFSTGKNGAVTSAYHADETENTDGDARFVSRTLGGTGDAFDDLVVAVPVGMLYARLTAAGVLP
jgi:prepilin-type N-terminal cleavage/methylation domain-containing protein